VLDDQPFDDGNDIAPREFGRAERAEGDFDFRERSLQQVRHAVEAREPFVVQRLAAAEAG